MKLKILHLTQFLGVGGLEKVLFLLIEEQLREGHEVELIVYDHEQSWVEYFRQHHINVNTNFRKNQGYDRSLLSFIETKAQNFDVIHTHDLNPLMYAAPLKFLHRLKRKPFPKLIHTAHGMDHLHKRPITKLYERLCSFMCDTTVGVSTAVCDYYFKLGVSKKQVVNINNGTKLLSLHESKEPARKWLRESFSLGKDRKVWVSVARILPLKDQKLICDLARTLPDDIFLLVGPSGDDQYWKFLSESRPGNVIMTGSRSDINQLLMGADFFISASHHEGIPVSVLEAGAVGIPCLLSDIDGHKVLQKDSQKNIAIFFKTGDILDLQLKVSKLRKNSEVSSAISLSLHEHVKKNFSSESMYQKYLNLYRGKTHA